ncbi:hypothetical protein Bca101_051500 [Brassica carinata]
MMCWRWKFCLDTNIISQLEGLVMFTTQLWLMLRTGRSGLSLLLLVSHRVWRGVSASCKLVYAVETLQKRKTEVVAFLHRENSVTRFIRRSINMVVDLENAGPKSQLRCPINDYNEGNLGSRSVPSVCSGRGDNTTFVLRLHLQYSALQAAIYLSGKRGMLYFITILLDGQCSN